MYHNVSLGTYLKINCKRTKTWVDGVTTPSISHLGCLVHVTKNSLRDRSLPKLGLIIKTSQEEIGQYSHLHPQSRSEFLGFLLDFSTPFSRYSQKILSRAPVNHHLKWSGRAVSQVKTKICHDISKSKNVACSWVEVGLKL